MRTVWMCRVLVEPPHRQDTRTQGHPSPEEVEAVMTEFGWDQYGEGAPSTC